MHNFDFQRFVGAGLALGALGATIYLAIFAGDSQIQTMAAGTLMGVAGSGASFFLGNFTGGKKDATVSVEPPANVTVNP